MPNCTRYSGLQSTFAAVDQQEVAVAVGHQGSQGRAFHAGDAAQAEHAAGQGRAGGAGGDEAVGFAAADLQHALDGRAVDFLAHAHDRAFMVGDDLRLLFQRQPVLDIGIIPQEGFYFIQFPGQDNF